MGSAHPLNAPYQSIATKDGWINVGAANQRNWLGMLNVINALHLADDQRFKNNPDRMANRTELIQELETEFKKDTTDNWVQRLNDAGIPAGPILDIVQMHKDEQAVAREMITTVEHPVAGTVNTIGTPVKFHGTPGGVTRAAPVLGQHGAEILHEVGYSQETIDTLADNGVVGKPTV